MRPTLRILLIWVLTASVLIGQAVLPNRRKVFQSAGGGETTLNDGLIAYWAMEEEGDTSVNRLDSQGANDLDAQGSTTLTNVTGKIGWAVDLERTNNDLLTIADNTDLSFGDEDFSIAVWVKFESKNAGQRIAAKYTGAGNQREYLLRYESTTDRFEFWVSPDGTATTTATANTFGSPSTATWYFVCAGHDSINNIIWISVNAGTRDTAAHSTGVFDGTSPFGQVAGGGWDGLLDEMAIWGKTLSTAEEAELYNAGSGITCCPFN